MGKATTKDIPPNPFKNGTQCYRIYRRLLMYRRVTNVEINLGLGGPRILNTTGRCSSIRGYLKDHGIALHCDRVRAGLFEYRVQ